MINWHIEASASPFIVNTPQDIALYVFTDHGQAANLMAPGGGDREELPKDFSKASNDIEALAAQLQMGGAKAFLKSWEELLGVIEKSVAIQTTAVG